MDVDASDEPAWGSWSREEVPEDRSRGRLSIRTRYPDQFQPVARSAMDSMGKFSRDRDRVITFQGWTAATGTALGITEDDRCSRGLGLLDEVTPIDGLALSGEEYRPGAG